MFFPTYVAALKLKESCMVDKCGQRAVPGCFRPYDTRVTTYLCCSVTQYRKEMQSAKEKMSNMASAAKEHVDVYKAKMEEKAEKAYARTEKEKDIAHERRKAKEAQSKMELHEAKARHAADKLNARQSHLYGHHQQPLGGAQHYVQQQVGTQGQQPVGTAAPLPGTTLPTYPYPPQGHRPGHNKYM